MSTSREEILQKLHDTQKPFPDAAPRSNSYLSVTPADDTAPQELLARFTQEMERLNGEVFVVQGDDEVHAKVLELLKQHNTKRILAWNFKHIPVKKLSTAIRNAGYTVNYPNIQQDNNHERQREIERLESAEVGLTGADAVAASTGTLIVSSAPGKGRIPTILPAVHIAIVTLDQLVSNVEEWLVKERAAGNSTLENSANICFISGPSRTADIEKQLVLGVHGPKQVQVIVKR